MLDPLSAAPFPGNRIPTNRLSAVTQNFIKYTPVPNTNIGGHPCRRQEHQSRRRPVRHPLRLSDLCVRFPVRALHQLSIVAVRAGHRDAGRQRFPVQRTQCGGAGDSHLQSAPADVFKFGYNRANVFNSWEVTPTSLANAIGLHINQVPAEYGLPGASVTGGYYVGGGTGINQGGIDNLFQFSDTVAGAPRTPSNRPADIRYVRFNQRLGLSNNGAFTFDGRYTGSSVGDFLLGNFSAATGQIGLGVGLWRSHSTNFFVSDDWNLVRLTLNLGLRYEYDSPYADARGTRRLLRYLATEVHCRDQPGPVAHQAEHPGHRLQPQSQPGIWSPDRNNFGPRVGVAYRLSDSTALRLGYGIFYAKTQGNELQFKVLRAAPGVRASLTGNATTPISVGIATLSPTRRRRRFRSARCRPFPSTRDPTPLRAAMESQPGAIARPQPAARSRLPGNKGTSSLNA